MPSRSVVRPSKANLDSARALDDKLLHRSWIVGGDRGAEPADRPVLVEPEPAVGRRHSNPVGGLVISDEEGADFAFAPVVALTRHRPARLGACGESGHRGEYEEGEGDAGHVVMDSESAPECERAIYTIRAACNESLKF